VEVDGEIYDVKLTPKGYEVAKPPEEKKIEGGIAAGLQGTILKIKAKKGDKVKEGDVIVLLEAMKMENDVVSPKSGVIKDILIKEGEEVSPDSILFAIGD
ncbi:MAG: biotin/lipoyl-binding protein, partial [Methanomicrobia archaeon]|nr:biotin/lipoyl-binding protein [Methanomicrobia archaeon]